MSTEKILNVREMMQISGVQPRAIADILKINNDELIRVIDFKQDLSLQQIESLRNEFGYELIESCMITQEERNFLLNPNRRAKKNVDVSWHDKYLAVTEELDKLRGEYHHQKEILKKYIERYGNIE